MAKYICEQCGIGFTREKSGDRPIRFCSGACYHEYRKGKIFPNNFGAPGFEPWNKNIKGIHLSEETEFKKGCDSNRKLPVGSVQIRLGKGKRKSAYVKVKEPNIWKVRYLVVWEEAYGPLPKGLVIHHIDRDTLNDNLANLCAMSRAAHLSEHRAEIRRKKNDKPIL
jgi:hypothetical protein